MTNVALKGYDSNYKKDPNFIDTAKFNALEQGGMFIAKGLKKALVEIINKAHQKVNPRYADDDFSNISMLALMMQLRTETDKKKKLRALTFLVDLVSTKLAIDPNYCKLS